MQDVSDTSRLQALLGENVARFPTQHETLFRSLREDPLFDVARLRSIEFQRLVQKLSGKYGIRPDEIRLHVAQCIQQTDGPLLLDAENFRANSADWEVHILHDTRRIKFHPLGDVVEVLDGPFGGEQYFSHAAAIRETGLVNRRLPTYPEWESALRFSNSEIDPRGGWQDDSSVRLSFNLRLAGKYSFSMGKTDHEGKNGYYWASDTPTENGGYHTVFSEKRINPLRFTNRTYGLSVRCVVEWSCGTNEIPQPTNGWGIFPGGHS